MVSPFLSSDIRIDSEGAWSYCGEEMLRQDIITLFYRHLQQDAEGRYYIDIGKQRYPVDVEDTAYVVWSLRWVAGTEEAEGCACLFLSDGSLEDLDPATLRIGDDHIPYCRIKRGRFDARFSRAAYYILAERLQHDPAGDMFFISFNGRKHYLECR